jgi:hypothetical protein
LPIEYTHVYYYAFASSPATTLIYSLLTISLPFTLHTSSLIFWRCHYIFIIITLILRPHSLFPRRTYLFHLLPLRSLYDIFHLLFIYAPSAYSIGHVIFFLSLFRHYWLICHCLSRLICHSCCRYTSSFSHQSDMLSARSSDTEAYDNIFTTYHYDTPLTATPLIFPPSSSLSFSSFSDTERVAVFHISDEPYTVLMPLKSSSPLRFFFSFSPVFQHYYSLKHYSSFFGFICFTSFHYIASRLILTWDARHDTYFRWCADFPAAGCRDGPLSSAVCCADTEKTYHYYDDYVIACRHIIDVIVINI